MRRLSYVVILQTISLSIAIVHVMSTHVFWLFLVTVVVLSRVLVHHPYSATTLGGTCISYALLFRTCESRLCSPCVMCAIWKVHYFCSL